MKQLSPLPEHWYRMEMPNLDYIGDLPANLNESDISWVALNGLPKLISKAQSAATHAVSWRDKIVGSTSFSIDMETKRIAYLSGFNVKPEEGEGSLNIHGEQMSILRMRYELMKHISAIAIWGEPEMDEATGITPLTLYPCELCVDFMDKSPEIDDSTAIISGNSDFSICEVYGLNDLKNYRNNPNDKTGFQRMTLTPDALEDRNYDEALMFLFLETWTRLNPGAPYAPLLREWFDSGQPLK